MSKIFNKSTTISPNAAYIFISIPIFMAISWSVFYFLLPTFFWNHDLWEHTATIREWTKNLWHPGNPHLAIDIGTPRYMPFFFLLSLVARLFNLNPFQALGIGGVLTLIILFSGVWLFFRLYFRNDWAPFIGLIILLFGWGVGWTWSNVYQLRSLFFVIVYPSSFVFGLTFFALWMMTKFLRSGTITFWNYITLVLITAFMYVCHPLTGAFAIISLCLLALFESHVLFSQRCKLVAAVLMGVLVAELWPYFSVWNDVILGATRGHSQSLVPNIEIVASRASLLFGKHPFYQPIGVFATLGPAWLGIPSMVCLILRRKYIFIILGFVVMILPYFGNLIFKIPLGHRFLLYAIFYLHLALTWTVLEVFSNLQTSMKNKLPTRSIEKKAVVLICIMALCILWNVTLAGLEFVGYHNFKLRNKRSIADDIQRVAFFIPEKAIVMAPSMLSWPLPTFSGKVVSVFHTNPLVTDRYQRYYDTFMFFKEETAQIERLKIIKRYMVTHILYSKDEIPKTVIAKINKLGSVTAKIDAYVVVELGKGI